MNATERRADDLIVVDENLDDYGVLIAEQHAQDLRIKLFATGESALHAARPTSGALWLINVRLPDMTGIHLLGLVRRGLRRCSVFLVGDRYSPEDELAARLAGATAYVCKPASAAWLRSHSPRCRSPAIRAGPRPSHEHEGQAIT
jgi:DNA-binding response OmpR family regulator